MMTNEEYIENNGNVCPNCGGTDIQTSILVERLALSVKGLELEVDCLECGPYLEEYCLTGWKQKMLDKSIKS
jgi:hypothetical protein